MTAPKTPEAAAPAKKARAIAPAHHIKARVWAIDTLLAPGSGVALSAVVGVAEQMADWLLRGDPSAEVVEARIMALRVARRAGVKTDAIYEHAASLEAYLVYGDAPPKPKPVKAEVPSTAGKAPAGERTTRDSEVPADAGDATRGRPFTRRGSSDHEGVLSEP